MGINNAYWLDRISQRKDMTCTLTHLTRNNEYMDALQVLIKILSDKKLIGSTNSGFIQGSESAVCFQNAPLSEIAQNVLYEEKLLREGKIKKERYSACGIMINKIYAFRKGARPVIYEEKEVAKQKFKDELWRVVTFNLNDSNNIIDWTHEREWRIKGDFYFELEFVTVILPSPETYQRFIKLVDPKILSTIQGIVVAGDLVF